jgi:hypothetical protein
MALDNLGLDIVTELKKTGFEDSRLNIDDNTLPMACVTLCTSIMKGHYTAYSIIRTGTDPTRYVGLVKKP